jgi:hypothetical protein
VADRLSISTKIASSLAFFVGGHIGLPFRVSEPTDTGSFPMRTKETEVLGTKVASGLIDRRPGDLKPWPGNPRSHDDQQLAKLKTSIQKFGFTAPVLVDEAGVILSGHGRVQAAKALELPTIPTRVIAGLSEAKKRAYVIADNKLAQLAGWDATLLKDELELLIAENFDIETTGFSTAEIDILFDGAEEPSGSDPDDLQPDDIAAEVVSRVGDLWRLGRIRDDDAASSCASFFYSPHQNAVVEWSKFCSHICRLPFIRIRSTTGKPPVRAKNVDAWTTTKIGPDRPGPSRGITPEISTSDCYPY